HSRGPDHRRALRGQTREVPPFDRGHCQDIPMTIPKPPYPWDITLEEELRQFELLKPKLESVWNSMTYKDDEPATSVVVPSLSLDQAELKRLAGSSFYEERLLFLLIRLRNPRARMVYVTSQPVHP